MNGANIAAYVFAVPFVALFFLSLPVIAIQHGIQHLRGKKSWLDELAEDDYDDYV